ncbi:MAG: hypothetical protein EB084_18495 [Proteobacteria bacterium]|nr:hypothetical protein [Pseudomonadota bacterium]
MITISGSPVPMKTPTSASVSSAEQPPAESAALAPSETSVQTSSQRDIFAADHDPTKDGRPLPPPGYRGIDPAPTPLIHKAVTAVCAGAGLWTLTNIATQIAGLPAAGAALAVAGSAAAATAAWALTDAGSGAFHFLVDNYGSPKTPVVGKMIREFQEHHVKPWDLEEVSVWSNCAQAGQVLGPALLAVAYANPHYLVQAAALSVLTAGYFAQASHRWAHMGERVAKPVKMLQNVGVFQNKKAHDAHHAQPVGTYCIVNGMANPLLDRLNVWRKAEYVIHKATGVEPNTWFDPEIKKKALGQSTPAEYLDPVKRQEGRRAFWKGMLTKIDAWRADDKPKAE